MKSYRLMLLFFKQNFFQGWGTDKVPADYFHTIKGQFKAFLELVCFRFFLYPRTESLLLRHHSYSQAMEFLVSQLKAECVDKNHLLRQELTFTAYPWTVHLLKCLLNCYSILAIIFCSFAEVRVGDESPCTCIAQESASDLRGIRMSIFTFTSLRFLL